MAFRLRKRRSVGRELSRVVTGEARKARDQMRHARKSADIVHAARKHIKKVRAILRMLEESLGDVYQSENRRLRARAHQLSAIRDADASLEVLTQIRDRYPRLVTAPVFASMRRGFLSRRRAAMERSHLERVLGRVVRDLRRTVKAASRRIREIGDPDTVGAGIVRGYRRARKSLVRVRNTPQDALFHSWRRRLKAHWYHVRLLQGFSRAARTRAAQLKRLEEWLGDDHNLVVFRDAVLQNPAAFGDERGTAVVLGCVKKFNESLRRRALTLGDRMFVRRPRAFQRTIEGWLPG